MITQQINISFSSAMAETIRIHTTEKGRQIVFVPDIEIPTEYNADIVIVKPDNTFVIERGTVSDGKILVDIPEQAGAVSGVGGYILKIYESDICVYSASGGLIVDDHLLMDSMIESVAEVYGYQFPQDFALKTETATLNDNVTASNSTWSSRKISEEIAAASPDIIDDNEVLYDKTWSSEKIAYELGNIQPYHVYSTTEQPVGRWIDGSTVYEKTFVITGAVSGIIQINMSGIKDFIFYSGHIRDNWTPPSMLAIPRVASDGNNIGIGNIYSDYFTLIIPSAFGSRLYDPIITIRYTKTQNE